MTESTHDVVAAHAERVNEILRQVQLADRAEAPPEQEEGAPTPAQVIEDRFDNRPTWDNWSNGPGRFDNRPTWDNWNNRR